MTTAVSAEPRRVEGGAIWIVLAVLAFAVLLNIGTLGSDPWAFRVGTVEPRTLSVPSSRLPTRVGSRPPQVGGDVRGPRGRAARRPGHRRPLLAAVDAGHGGRCAVVALLVLPAVALQAGLRDATAPWFHVNDSTYQIELAGEIVLDGETPYGRDYSRTGLERFYSLDGSVTDETRERQVALRHFAYFPGTALLGAAWRVLPSPWDDFRFLVALSTLGLLAAALAIPGPLWAQLSLGVAAAANPIMIRGAWFGTADAPALLLLLLAFALAARRAGWAGALLGGAVLAKQFALVAVPFIGVILLTQLGRAAMLQAATSCTGVLVAGFALRDRRPGSAGPTPSNTAPTRTESSVTGSLRSCSSSESWRTGKARIRSRSSCSSSGFPRQCCSSARRCGRKRTGSLLRASPSRCTCCSSWDGSFRSRTWRGRCSAC